MISFRRFIASVAAVSLGAHVCARGEEEELGDDEVEEVLKMTDGNGDGKLTLEELQGALGKEEDLSAEDKEKFSTKLKDWFPQVDKDSDGTLDKEEIKGLMVLIQNEEQEL
eukprot:TRINITY_DN2262_c0_g1_i2.p1 TRINITY_DN2262_c0_g1~~TRINITY_DN2262_c0_g1_i2.p1  ORF type:complete len:111 (+),score=37.47 TRINITY_DN2262_c0_g1_i2:31-363(+)